MGRVSFKSFAVWFLSGLAAIFILHRLGSETVTRDAVTFESKHAGKFSWSQIEPRSTLHWTSCDLAGGVSFECARLQVPLNYFDPEGPIATIAMTRIPALVASDSAEYRGPILFNPGGPGGSGVDMIATAGRHFQSVVGPHFDILGFDPRGVGHSTPGFSLYESEAERAANDLTTEGFQELDLDDGSLGKAWAKAVLAGQLVKSRSAGIFPFINTDHTARDMLEIVKAHGREKINYWGFSYGTILGGTFASMFPDKIERLVIDGVVDTDTYYNTLWDENLLDTDATMQNFFDSCHAAGPRLCAFYASTPKAISQNLVEIYNRLLQEPIPVYNEKDGKYAVVDYEFLRARIFSSLYKPYTLWAPLAEALAELLQGNGTKALDLDIDQSPVQDECDANEREFRSGPEVTSGIGCNDGHAIPSDYNAAKEHFERVSNISEWGSIWARVRISCSGWPQSPQPHFQGPIGAANTSHPILLVGNRYDPVTPWIHANNTHARFPGSALLSQDSPGVHCSIAAPSPCTHQYIREYFVNGTLPEPGAWCSTSRGPFDLQGSILAGESAEQVHYNLYDDLVSVAEALVKAVTRFDQGGFGLHV